MSSKGSSAVGIVVAILIVGAVATIGYYQVEVAPQQLTTSTTTTSGPAVNCQSHPSSCVNITIVSGASSPYSGYSSGSATLYGYDPLSVTLVIGVNNTVVFTNLDSAFHTATAASTDPVTFDSGCLDGAGAACPSGQGAGVSTYQITFTVAGTYVYHCNYHPWMQGKITVVQGSVSTTTTAGGSTTSASSAAPATVQATIVSGANSPYSGYSGGSTQLYGYSPQNITVVIGVNNTVTWTNMDSAFHTVTAASADPATFDSGCLNGVGAPCPGPSAGSSFTFTFTVPGVYVYHCSYHPWMRGVVTVLAA